MIGRRKKEDCKLQIGFNVATELPQFAIGNLQFAICNSSSNTPRSPSSKYVPKVTASPPRGISLLEVVIALAIFLAATTVIGQLISTGSQAAIGAQLKAEAARRCETVMSEAIAGVVPLETSGDVAFEDDPHWTWSLVVAEAPVTDLVQIEARVNRQTRAGQPPTTMSLVRWVRDPALWTQSTVESSSGGTP